MKKLFTTLFVCFAFVAFAQDQDPGTVDLTFGTDGTFRFAPSNHQDFLESILVQEDGKIITVGRSRTDGDNYGIYVSRHNVDGSLDETYGEGGISHFKVNPTIYINGAREAVLSDDGLLYIAGYTYDYENNTSFILCLDENGFENPEFGNEGWVETPKGGGIVYEAIDVDSEGRPIITGYLNDHILVRRYSVSGEEEFSTNLTPNEVADPKKPKIGENAFSFPKDIKVLDNNEIIVVGSRQTVWFIDEQSSEAVLIAKTLVSKFKSDGTLDTSFGNNGIVEFNVGEFAEFAVGVDVDADGNFLVTGHSELPSINSESQLPRYESFIVRITKEGVLDTTFGTDGVVRFEVFEGDGCVNNSDTSPIVASDGQIFGTFYSYNFNDYSSRAYIYNLDAEGKLKENFVGEGVASVPIIFGEDDVEIRTASLVLQDDKLFVGGLVYRDTNGDFADGGEISDIFISKLYTDVKVDDENGNDTLGLAEVTNNAFGIYPNPASSQLFVKSETNAQVSIIDLTGRVVKEIETTDEITTIDINDVNEGVYFIMIQDENNRIVEKLVVR